MSDRKGHWFLPETPDVIGMLQKQAEITDRGMVAFSAWADGDSARADDVRAAEHECDQVRRNLADAVSEAFTTPLPPEDLFQLSRDLDRVMNGAKDTVRESEAMAFPPDKATAEMASLLAEGVAHLVAPHVTRFHGFLHVHAVIDHVDEDLHMALRLHAAAHEAEGHPRFAVFHCEGGDDRVEGALARRVSVRMIRIKIE